MANWKCNCGNTNHGKAKTCLACGATQPVQPAGGNPNPPAPAGNPAPQGGQPAPGQQPGQQKPAAEQKKKFGLEVNVSPLGEALYRLAIQFTEDGKAKQGQIVLMGLHPTDRVTDSNGAPIDWSAPVPTNRKGLLLLNIEVSDAMGRTKRQVFCRAAGNQADTSSDLIPLAPPKFEVDQTQTGWGGFWRNISAGFKYNRGGK